MSEISELLEKEGIVNGDRVRVTVEGYLKIGPFGFDLHSRATPEVVDGVEEDTYMMNLEYLQEAHVLGVEKVVQDGTYAVRISRYPTHAYVMDRVDGEWFFRNGGSGFLGSDSDIKILQRLDLPQS